MLKPTGPLTDTTRRLLTHGARLLALAWLGHIGTLGNPPVAWAEQVPAEDQADTLQIRPLQRIDYEQWLDLTAAASDSAGDTTSDALPHGEGALSDEASPHGDAGDLLGEAEPVAEEAVRYGCGRCPGVCRCPGHPAKPRRTMPGDVDRGDCPPRRYRIDQRLRSGDPNCVYKWAQPTYTQKYSAWYVGGGGGFIRGRSRTAEEGTWGLDYNGLFGHAKVWLNYTCNRYQGGEGAYETEHQSLRSKLQQH